jgi:hypothetical protein
MNCCGFLSSYLGKHIQENKMFNEIIFVDFENFTKIIDGIKRIDAKIIVLVGLNQDKKAFNFAEKLLDYVSSIELLKVKGVGKNALDFFITYYLGIYISRNKELKFTICSNDQGYDPLIKHLSENRINIKREKIIEKEPEVKVKSKTKKQSNLFETDKDYKKAFSHIKDVPKNRPKTLKKMEKDLKTLFHEAIEMEKIKEIINELEKCKYIEIENENEKIKYNI